MAKKTPATTPAAAEKPSNLFRKLTRVFLVNSAKFVTSPPSVQTNTLKKADGLPIEFVADFFSLSNRKVIREALLQGKDVSRELEFNGVVLSPEELSAIDLVKPILEKIEGIGPSYPWLEPLEFPSILLPASGTGKITRGGHTVSVATAKRIWQKASKFWSSQSETTPTRHEIKANSSYYSSTRVIYVRDAVKVGCQTIPRAEVEFIARKMGWEPEISAE